MKRDYITFRSITPAQQGQRVLHNGGVETMLQRTPRQLEQLGCGYCLRLRPDNLQEALLLLRQSNVPFHKIFTQEDGVLEELPL